MGHTPSPSRPGPRHAPAAWSARTVIFVLLAALVVCIGVGTAANPVDGNITTPTTVPIPLPGPPTLVLSPTAAQGLTVTVGGSATPGTEGATIMGISWNWGDGTVENAPIPNSHTYAASGSYTITVTAAQSDGLSTTIRAGDGLHADATRRRHAVPRCRHRRRPRCRRRHHHHAAAHAHADGTAHLAPDIATHHDRHHGPDDDRG